MFEARATVDAKSSEFPLASLDIVLAVAGATVEEINASGIKITGVTTSTQFKVGTAVTINSDGADIVGIVTATSFVGSGENLTNLPASGDANDITACLFI